MKWLKTTFYVVVTLVAIVAITLYSALHSSLPLYEGNTTAEVTDKVQLSRDAQGYLTVRAKNRLDAAYGLGYAHAQDRFFQMDLLRRNAAGELSELFGERALQLDISRRMHRFRDRSEAILATLPPAQRLLLKHYTQGVNEGLSQLPMRPFEYWLVRQAPATWRETDSLLVIYSMYLDLQSSTGYDELAQGVLKKAIPADWYKFLNQHSSDWQAAIDGSTVTAVPMPESPYPQVLSDQKVACLDCQLRDSRDIGSNNFAVSGKLTSHGGAMLADDMHLGIRVPGTWFKAQLIWGEGTEQHSVAGVSLPGAPSIVAGSNGNIAWGFTNSTADWHDVIQLQADENPQRYLTPGGPREYSYNNEVIKVKGLPDVVILIKETEWGPVLPAPFDQYALRWVAYDPQALNLELQKLEETKTVDEALKLASKVGLPAQNLLVVDREGNQGWTIIGPIPKRTLQDMDTPQDWSTGNNYWDGYIGGKNYPSVKNPDSQRLWTANSRVVGGKALKRLGDGGYDLGARGMQIREGLLAKEQHTEQSLHQIQLDHRALFLKHWQQLLLEVLTDDFVARHQLGQYRSYVELDSDSASQASIGYSLVRAFRDQSLQLVFAPLASLMEQQKLKLSDLKLVPETPGWALIQAKRPDTVPAPFISWQQLLEQAVLQSRDTLLAKSDGDLANARWGLLNTAKIEHPLSSAIPWFGQFLNMPATEMAGDRHMPRVQLPVHGQSERMVVAPGHEATGILTIPAGQSGHPLSPFYRADHAFWLEEAELGFLPGEQKYLLELQPRG
ncbi:MAG: penicillin acylase family protein [Gammaproteobacteria bacterium]|nr:penicillin acylase family protein [Gammaproteobacteria bacterium]